MKYDFIRYNSLMRTVVPPDVGPYSYGGTSYANPDAPTSIGNDTATFERSCGLRPLPALSLYQVYNFNTDDTQSPKNMKTSKISYATVSLLIAALALFGILGIQYVAAQTATSSEASSTPPDTGAPCTT